MHIRKLLIAFGLWMALAPVASAVVGVSSSDLQGSANIVLPTGSSLERLPGYNNFELATQYSVDGGVVARYEARLERDPWEEDEIINLKLMAIAYSTQSSAAANFATLKSRMAAQHEVLDSDDREILFVSEQHSVADAFSSVSGEYDSFHLLELNGEVIFQASLYRTGRTYDSSNLAVFEALLDDEEAIYSSLKDAVQSSKVAMALLFPPDSADLTAKTERSSMSLDSLYSMPQHGSVAFDLYVGEIEGAVGTILDSSGLGDAVEGDLYLYIHNDGRLFSGIYAPEYDANCVQQAGWYRVQSSGALNPYEWNEVGLNFGVEGFELSLNGKTVGCEIAQPRSESTLYFGDFPDDGVEQSMVGYLDNVVVSAGRTSAGELWDELLETQLFADLSNLDVDLAVFQFMKDEGIFVGSEGYLYPDDALNRAAMLKVLLKAYGYSVGSTASTLFSDVPSTAWYAPYVQTAYGIGMVEGNPDGSFLPGAEINRAEFYTMLQRLAGASYSYDGEYSDVDSEDWYAGAAAYAAATGLVDEAYFGPTKIVTRREAARTLYALIR